MVLKETTRSLFPADLFIQPGDQPPVISQDLTQEMLALYEAPEYSLTRNRCGRSLLESNSSTRRGSTHAWRQLQAGARPLGSVRALREGPFA